jgi:long-chain fatty acid transport protein
LRIPDSDRYWLSAGTTYTINERYSVDFGYTHVFTKEVSISETPFEGSSSGHINIVGLSLNARF